MLKDIFLFKRIITCIEIFQCRNKTKQRYNLSTHSILFAFFFSAHIVWVYVQTYIHSNKIKTTPEFLKLLQENKEATPSGFKKNGQGLCYRNKAAPRKASIFYGHWFKGWFTSVLCRWSRENSRALPKILGPWHSCGSPGRSFLLLVFFWHSPSHCHHLESAPAEEYSLTLLLTLIFK